MALEVQTRKLNQKFRVRLIVSYLYGLISGKKSIKRTIRETLLVIGKISHISSLRGWFGQNQKDRVSSTTERRVIR